MNKLFIVIPLLLVGCIVPLQPAPLSPQTIIDNWEAHGLEIENAQPLTGESLPPGALSGIQFQIKACGNCGGKLIVFREQKTLLAMADIWQSFGQHIATKELILIQINGNLPAEIAAPYLD